MRRSSFYKASALLLIIWVAGVYTGYAMWTKDSCIRVYEEAINPKGCITKCWVKEKP